MIEGVGPWRNFDEIEESLILDELLLLHEVLGKSKHANYRMLASFQGIDLGDIEETGADDLPEEVLAAEREYAKKKAEHMSNFVEKPEEVAGLNEVVPGGFGYIRQ